MKKLTTFLILLANLVTCHAQETASAKTDVCDCPEPSETDFTRVCNSIYDKKSPTDVNAIIAYKYQEDLYKMSCVDISIDSKDVIYEKIRCMWNKNKEKFRCFQYDGVSVPNSNVLKFCMDVNFSTFLVTAVKKYKLELNFIDPADGKTIMDFLDSQLKSYRNADYVDKANEYQRIYELLKANGAKHSSELNK